MGAYVVVDSVVTAPAAGVREAFVDAPREASRVEARAVDLEGWVLGRERRVVAVEARAAGRTLGRTKLGLLPRPDLAAAFPDLRGAADAGFRLTADLRGPERGVEVELVAILAGGEPHTFATMRGSRAWRASSGPERDFVSVVIPCYRQAQFLPESIESALAQRHPYVEILVVDDGSPDNTEAVAERYPTVRYLRQENAGPSGARNAGIRQTNGDYLLFLDADDRLLPDALEAGLAQLREHPEAAFAWGHHRVVAADGTVLGESDIPCPGTATRLSLLRRNHIAMHGTVLYRRAVFEHVHGFDPGLKAAEDYELYLRIARRFGGSCHHRVVADYRLHGNSLTRAPEAVGASSLAVLRRHRPARAEGDAIRHAYRDGRRFVLSYYGGANRRRLGRARL